MAGTLLFRHLRNGSALSQSCLTQLQVTSKHLPCCNLTKVAPATNLSTHDKWSSGFIAPATLPDRAGFVARMCHKLAADDQHDKEIYSGILSTQIKLVKAFSLTTSLIGVSCQTLLYSYAGNTNIGVMLASGAFLSFFTFVTPVLIHSISKKYVTKLYYNQVEDKYTAIVYNIFIRPKKIEFRLRDVKVPDIPGMFTTFKAKGHALFVDMDQFRDPTHFGKLMGYQDDLNIQRHQQSKSIDYENDNNSKNTSFELDSNDLAKKEDTKMKH
jgi:transmembrane protein 70